MLVVPCVCVVELNLGFEGGGGGWWTARTVGKSVWMDGRTDGLHSD